MSFLSASLYDRCMKHLEETCLIEWRRELLKDIEGRILEIGAGTGASLALYPQGKNSEIYLAEPDRDMRLQLKQNIKDLGLKEITVLSCPAEQITSADNFYDVVFVSLVCCSVHDLSATLLEIKRVLKPGGRFIFLEHVADTNGSTFRKWQDLLTPIWRKIAGNCHLNRDTEKHITEASFTLCTITHEDMTIPLSLTLPTIRGIAKAVKPSIY